MTTRWMTCVWLVAAINLTALVVVSVLQQMALQEIDQSDFELRVLLLNAVERRPKISFSQEARQLLYGEPDLATTDDVNMAQDGNDDSDVTHDSDATRHKRQFGFDTILSDILRAQEEVIVAHCSNHSSVCMQGSKGEKGVQGPTGATGPKGVAGPTGAKGVTGAAGVKGQPGAAGADGPQGPKGDTGAAGVPGLKGDTGARGSKGDTGLAGDTGHSGPQGDKGDPGQSGAAGLAGPKGVVGNQGQKGERGPEGTKGAPGTQGPPGDAGAVLGQGCECLKAPKITNLPSAVTAQPGAIVSVTCQAEGNPSPTITWDGGRQSSVLKMDHLVFPTDFHNYTCTATNPFGHDSQSVSIVRG